MNLTPPPKLPRYLVIEIPGRYGARSTCTTWENAHAVYANGSCEAAKLACQFFDSQDHYGDLGSDGGRIVEVKEEKSDQRERICVRTERVTIYLVESDQSQWPALADDAPEFVPNPPPPSKQWTAKELEAREREIKQTHRSFVRYLWRRSPVGWKIRPIFKEWRDGGMYCATLTHYEIRTLTGNIATFKGDYSGRITDGWKLEQQGRAYFSTMIVTAPSGRSATFSDEILA